MTKKVDEENTRRQKIERIILAEVREMINKKDDLPETIILFSKNWHPGVLGLCASRLCEEFCRPAILLSVDMQKDEARGFSKKLSGL